MNTSESDFVGFVLRPYQDESSPRFRAITKDIGHMGIIKTSRFGTRLEYPEIKDFFSFAGIKQFRTGHWAYNSFGFSTQVPARVQYLCSKAVEFECQYWDNIYIADLAEDLSIFERFNELEYIFVNCFLNHQIIVSDAHYKNNDKLLIGIVKKMNEMAATQPLDRDKVWTEVLKFQPELSKYKKY